jgi:hypothetical protein
MRFYLCWAQAPDDMKIIGSLWQFRQGTASSLFARYGPVLRWSIVRRQWVVEAQRPDGGAWSPLGQWARLKDALIFVGAVLSKSMTGSEQGLIWPREEDARGYTYFALTPDFEAIMDGKWDPGSQAGTSPGPPAATESDAVKYLLQSSPGEGRPQKGVQPEPAEE